MLRGVRISSVSFSLSSSVFMFILRYLRIAVGERDRETMREVCQTGRRQIPLTEVSVRHVSYLSC